MREQCRPCLGSRDKGSRGRWLLAILSISSLPFLPMHMSLIYPSFPAAVPLAESFEPETYHRAMVEQTRRKF